MTVLLLAVTVLAVLQQPARIASGYCAKRLCSEVFLAGRSPDDVHREDLALMPLPMSLSVDRAQKTASVRALWVSQTAAWRPGLGCALTTGTTVEALQAQGFTPAEGPAEAPWPGGDKLPEATLPAAIDAAKLDAAIADAFAEPDPQRRRHTRAVVVVYKGQLVAERYGEGYDRHTRLLGWSMTKSVTQALLGLLVAEGKLDIHAPAPVPQWRDDERAAITTDQLLRMSSGLRFDETYGAFGDVTAMLFTNPDTASYAAAFPSAAPPDTVWSYSSGTTNILSRIMRDTIGDDAAYHRFPHAALLSRLGAHSAVMETDPSGTFVGSSFLYMTARDWARFGMLYLQDGVWEGERLLPEGWAKAACTPTPPAPQGAYGAQWWTNAGTPGDPSDRPRVDLPPDACAARGYEQQRVMIIPSRELVIVRLGQTRFRDAFDPDAWAAKVLSAFP